MISLLMMDQPFYWPLPLYKAELNSLWDVVEENWNTILLQVQDSQPLRWAATSRMRRAQRAREAEQVHPFLEALTVKHPIFAHKLLRAEYRLCERLQLKQYRDVYSMHPIPIGE